MTEVNALLLELQKMVRHPYLSDLHSNPCFMNQQMRALLTKIPLERYSISAWNGAASYIGDENCCFQTAEEARYKIAIGR